MSTTFTDIPQLRVWDEHELAHRDLATAKIAETVRTTLSTMNRAWTFRRLEAPALTPRDLLSPEYTDEDLWTTPITHAERQMVMRAETTAGTYDFVRRAYPHKALRLPACFWQVGKSYRREQHAVASRLRFFEFTQLEFQCLFSRETKADYRAAVMPALETTLSWLCDAESRVIPSDRLPSYAESTLDVEVRHLGKWREVASVSLRTDFAPDVLNLEVAVGLDRVVDIFHTPKTVA